MFSRPGFVRLVYGAIVIVSLFIGYRVYAAQHALTKLAEAPMGNAIGPQDADIVIAEIVDYRCSYCREMHKVMQDVAAKHPDVRIVFRHYPGLGMASLLEAEFALAAGMQGKFLPVHNYLMDSEAPLDESQIPALAARFGLDANKLAADMKGPETGAHMIETVDMAQILGIGSTPTFIVDRKIIRPLDMGRLPVAGDFDAMIEKARR